MRRRSRSRERCVVTRPVTCCSGGQKWTLVQTNSCCSLPPEPDPCECSTDFYTQLLGPTADETLLSGFATLQAMVNRLKTCAEVPCAEVSPCKCCKCGEAMIMTDIACCKCGTPRKKKSLFGCRKSTEKCDCATCCKRSKSTICCKSEPCSTEIQCTDFVKCCTTSHGTQCKCYKCCPPKIQCVKNKEVICCTVPKECEPPTKRKCYRISAQDPCHPPDCTCYICCPVTKKCYRKSSRESIGAAPITVCCTGKPDCICYECCPPKKKSCQVKIRPGPPPTDCPCPPKAPCICSKKTIVCQCGGCPANQSPSGKKCPAKCAPCNCGRHLIYYD